MGLIDKIKSFFKEDYSEENRPWNMTHSEFKEHLKDYHEYHKNKTERKVFSELEEREPPDG